MNFSAYSIRNPIPAILLFVLLTVVGLMSYKALKVQDFPDIELPVVNVVIALPGAAPAQLETDVARKVEDAVANLAMLKNTYGRVNDGTVTIAVEFELGKSISDAVNEVRDAVSSVRSNLPTDILEPTVSKVSTAGRVILTYVAEPSATITATRAKDLDDQEVSWFVDNTVTKRLLAVRGVGAVKRIGGVTRQIQIELNPSQMSALGVTAADVSRQLKRVQQESPSGRADISGAEQTIRTIGTVKSVAEIAKLDIPLLDGRVVRLDQMATVKDTVAEIRAIATYNGKPVVGIEVYRTKGGSEIDIAKGVEDAMGMLQKEHPDIQLKQVMNNATPIAENFKGSMDLLYEGALLAILVIWWFLRDFRAMMVASTALPLSIIPTFLGLQYFGYTLNTVTLLALALVVGVLVDDAIVEIENIERHLRMGKKPYQAAMEAADEIGLAVVATTLSLVAVFLPTAFMAGVPGLFFKQFGWTAVIAILSSLVVARLLTPMMAAYFLKPKPEKELEDGWVMQRYIRAVKWCLNHRLITMLAVVVFFVGSLFLTTFLSTGFVPAADRNQTQISIELPPGSTLAETKIIAEQARQLAMTNPNIKDAFSSVGGGASGDAFGNQGILAEARKAVITFNTTHRSQRKESLSDIDNDLRAKMSTIAGARFNVGQVDTGTKMQLVLQSEDTFALQETAKQVERELRTLKGIGNVSSSASLVRPEIVIKPDFAKAADLGVTADSIGAAIRVATSGDYDVALSKLNLAERQVPILVKLPDDMRSNLDAIARLPVPSNTGSVMLGSVADISMSSGPAEIGRLNRKRNVTFDVELGGRALGEVNSEARALPTLQHLPANVHIAELGDAEEMKKLFGSFGIAMAIGVFCIFAILVLLFHDFLQPLTILVALPLSIGGAIVALLITNKALSMPSMIGLIMLMGIVTKNSILLIDYAVLARGKGLSRFDALVDACHKRARPILMTTIAMGAGMMPLALGFGADPSFRSPMAVTVIGGLITSTLLSLLVVPVVYTLVDGAKRRTKHAIASLRQKQNGDEPTEIKHP